MSSRQSPTARTDSSAPSPARTSADGSAIATSRQSGPLLGVETAEVPRPDHAGPNQLGVRHCQYPWCEWSGGRRRRQPWRLSARRAAAIIGRLARGTFDPTMPAQITTDDDDDELPPPPAADRRRAALRRELIYFGIAAGLGILVLPFAVYLAGAATLGPYDGGILRFLGKLYGDFITLSPGALALLFGPYALFP